jgi:sorbitol-specific phosphotransferase system component IIA
MLMGHVLDPHHCLLHRLLHPLHVIRTIQTQVKNVYVPKALQELHLIVYLKNVPKALQELHLIVYLKNVPKALQELHLIVYLKNVPKALQELHLIVNPSKRMEK